MINTMRQAVTGTVTSRRSSTNLNSTVAVDFCGGELEKVLELQGEVSRSSSSLLLFCGALFDLTLKKRRIPGEGVDGVAGLTGTDNFEFSWLASTSSDWKKLATLTEGVLGGVGDTINAGLIDSVGDSKLLPFCCCCCLFFRLDFLVPPLLKESELLLLFDPLWVPDAAAALAAAAALPTGLTSVANTEGKTAFVGKFFVGLWHLQTVFFSK